LMEGLFDGYSSAMAGMHRDPCVRLEG